MTVAPITLMRWALAAYAVVLTVATHWPKLDLPGQQSVPLGLDKWMHVLAFGVLAVLIVLARPFACIRRTVVWGTAMALAYAGLNECTQSLMPGRTFDPLDPIASAFGIALAACGFVGFRVLRRTDDSIFAHARTMAGLTLVSRVFGLFRDVALAMVFGFGWVFDAFAIAFLIPNLFRRLFGEGALAGAFIPHYTKLRRRNVDAAERFASITIGMLWLVLAALAMIGFLIMIALLRFGGLDERGDLAVTLTMLSIWYAPMVCVAAICSAMLQVHGRFALPAAMPIVLNVLIIAAAFIGYATMPAGETLGTPLLVIIAVILAGLLQVTLQTHALRRDGIYLRWYRSTWRGPDAGDAVRGMTRQWLPTAIGLAVFQFNTMMDSLIAMFFSGPPGETFRLLGNETHYPMQTGAVAILGASARLYEFPLGVFGIAVATAIFPAISRLADQRDAFSELIRQGLRLTIFIGLPASVGLLLVRQPLSEAIYYQFGNIQPEDSQRIAWVLLGYAPAIWAYSMNHILVRAFYAQHDARTPMLVSVAMVVMNLGLNLILIWPLGLAGLAWSTAVSAIVQTGVLLYLVQRHADGPVSATVRGSWRRSAAATAVMAAALWPTVHFGGKWAAASEAGWPAVVAVLIGSVIVGAATFAAAARLFRMQELDWLLSRKAPATEHLAESSE